MLFLYNPRHGLNSFLSWGLIPLACFSLLQSEPHASKDTTRPVCCRLPSIVGRF